MSFRIKPGLDVLGLLKAAGYSAYKLRQNGIMGERSIQKLRDGGLPSWGELDKICHLLRCQPWDLIEYGEDNNSPAT